MLQEPERVQLPCFTAVNFMTDAGGEENLKGGIKVAWITSERPLFS